MHVMLLGATGFIGSRLADALAAAGHRLTCAARDPAAAAAAWPRHRWVAADLARQQDPQAWLPLLQGVDVVVNAAGILKEGAGQAFGDLHLRGPCALFDACVLAGVPRVVQLSSLGADADAATGYHRSKAAADAWLLGLPLGAVVAQPSLVFGADGRSSQLFLALAALPVLALPAGEQWVQPVHVDDAVAALLRLVESPDFDGRRVAIVGPQALGLRAYLLALRAGMGLGRPLLLPLPHALVDAAAAWSARLGIGLLDEDTWSMLRRGNTADAADTQALLGRPPRPAAQFVSPADDGVRQAALLAWLLPLLRASLAAVWIVTAVVSAFVHPREDSLALLAATGITGAPAPWALYGASALDLLLGLLTLLRPGRRLWLAQMALILFYTAVISACLPQFWSHPYGPLLKNLPMLAVLVLLHAMERPAGKETRR